MLESALMARHNPCSKFLCAKTGFTQLRRRRHRAPVARRHEAGFPLPSPKNQNVQKFSQKKRKSFKVRNLRIWFLKIFLKKQEV